MVDAESERDNVADIGQPLQEIERTSRAMVAVVVYEQPDGLLFEFAHQRGDEDRTPQCVANLAQAQHIEAIRFFGDGGKAIVGALASELTKQIVEPADVCSVRGRKQPRPEVEIT